ncbi:thioredoxin [Mobiluncus mulieris]|uniref:hypothetical protein n=1 Tax=Mobiluncus mulieris TaxID=2052 RepID=UPI0001E51DD2|nr:hypothetical protein [Mobiluncus mulieris]EFN93075.1 hypothetical protein HMPREF9278_1738 [Mobiluncus mulieris FB024-16]MCU9994808.1 thioredoxin [Mobiluncus mulieris]NMW60835.1 thioredoxin [Mobiluncus mulieris]
MSGVPSPAAMTGDDLPDYREALEQAKDAPLDEQLALLQRVNAALQDVLRKD